MRSLCVAAGSTKSTTTPASLRRMHAHDAADPLLVDAAAGRRREVHADGRARRVPALREQLRVHEDVDLAALVGGQRLGQLERRRLPAHRLGLQPGRAELPRQVVGVLDAGRVDDARRLGEAVAVEARRRLVDQLVVEHLRQGLLVEVAADDRHRRDGGRRTESAASAAGRSARAVRRRRAAGRPPRPGRRRRPASRSAARSRSSRRRAARGSCGSRRSSSRRARCAPRRR